MHGQTSFISPDAKGLGAGITTQAEPDAGPPVSRLETLRASALRAFLAVGWLLTGCMVALSLAYGQGAWWCAIASAIGNLLAAWLVKEPKHQDGLRWAVILLVSLQPLALLVSLRLSGLESLTPLAIFVGLMALTAFCDQFVVWATSMLSFLALLLIALIAPNWLFVGEELWRDALYATEHLIVTAVAATIADRLRHLIAELEDAERGSATRANALHIQADQLAEALQRLETERQDRERSDAQQSEARKTQMQRIALDFENSISTVTQSIATTGSLLERTTKALNAIAHDTGESAKDVSVSAEAASNAARTVAEGVSQLSHSIANIAVNVSQQNDLTSHATRKSQTGGEAVGGLSSHSDTIGEATRAIVRIAERTNLLSLNAAIEAATAGPAGRGFTIVAQEVKALASQANDAATQIDAFLSGVRSGTLEAESSFEAIDCAITELAEAATAIRWDVESQRKSADTIENYARAAAEDVGAMARRSKTLASTASSAKALSTELDDAAAAMMRNVRDLEQSTAQFMMNLKVG